MLGDVRYPESHEGSQLLVRRRLVREPLLGLLQQRIEVRGELNRRAQTLAGRGEGQTVAYGSGLASSRWDMATAAGDWRRLLRLAR